MMIILIAAFVLMSAGWLAEKVGKLQVARWGRAAYLGALFVWFVSVSGLFAIRGGEEGLLRWYAWGQGAALIGAVAALWPRSLAWLPAAAMPVSAALYALGFDPFRPDAYSYRPAAIIGSLVLLVAGRVFLLYYASVEGVGRLALAAWILATAGLVYASAYKMMDRGWLLSWAYLAGAGGLLFATSQLGWARSRLSGDGASGRSWRAALDLAHLLIVAAAFFHYRQFL
jgi:hypothetical protein